MMKQVAENCGMEETVVYSVVPLLVAENMEYREPYVYNEQSEVGLNPCLLDEKDFKVIR
jgi:hypothetical protein